MQGAFNMKKIKEVVYMVIYFDDEKQKHMAFVKGFSAVKFLEERFGNVYFERTETYLRVEVD